MMELPMSTSQSASIAQGEWISVAGPKRDLDARSDQHNEIQPMRLAIESSHPSSVDEGQVASDRPSIVSRKLRLPHFFIAVVIGIGATLGWQSYGDTAREIVVEQIPTLASLLPVSTTKSRALAATSPEIVQQLLPLTFGINVMRRSVDQLAAKQDQLAAKQEQLAQNIAVLQAAIEEDVRQKVSPAPPTPAQQDASKQQPKLSQPKARPQALHSSSVPRPSSATTFVSR
jgi:hypothetical protein